MPKSSGAPTRFTYVGFDVDPVAATLTCRYDLDGEAFTERFGLEEAADLSTLEAVEAARLLFLLAGVSYYKTGAPPFVDLGAHPVTAAELELLEHLYRDGLGEFAHVNGLDLATLRIEATLEADPEPLPPMPTAGPLVPFGGGIDSIVTVDVALIAEDDPALFVVSRPGDRFEAIEGPASLTGLDVVRVWRELDGKLLDGVDRGYRNGHVPVTAIISAAAVWAAAATGRGPVVMSNERSASAPALVDGREVNHQWSKSWAFEQRFAAVLAKRVPSVGYFSMLRPCSELWVAERFARLRAFHPLFRSCNRSFTIDPAKRLDRWCGACDKCAFIDLVLAPFLTPPELEAIFNGDEPLANPEMATSFSSLLGLGEEHKPFECVGDLDECTAAVVMAANRDDRQHDELLQRLAVAVPPRSLDALEAMLHPSGPHGIPDAYLAAAGLG